MFCPKCGKLQVSDDVRFCTKCGLPLEGAATMLTSGGHSLAASGAHKGLSPRARGILQGIALIPGLFGAMLVLDIFYEAVFNAGMLGGLYASITLILLTALARILYAVFVEEGHLRTAAPPIAARETSPAAQTMALPASTEQYIDEFEPQNRETGAMAQPRSVTENTTTKLKSIE